MKTFRVFSASLLIVTLLLWVMPLGVFIKASQEKTACGGGRAFHMCSMMKSAVSSHESRSSKVKITSTSHSERTSKPGTGGSGNDFLMVFSQSKIEKDSTSLFVTGTIRPTSFISKPFEQVPKF